MGARVHLFIQFISTDGWDVRPERRREGNASSRYRVPVWSRATSLRRHIWAVFFETGCLIWYRRQPPCECGLVLPRTEAAARTDVTRSSSFWYTSERRNFTRTCCPTGKHRLTWPSDTILLLIARSRFRRANGLRGNHVFYIYRSFDTVIITNG